MTVVRKIKIIEDLTENKKCNEGFLRKKHYRVKNLYETGGSSRDYNCDVVYREQTDAVGVVIFLNRKDSWRVVLRKCLRPPMMFRKKMEIGNEYDPCFIWEIPAGIIEKGEENETGIDKRASVEIYEETGLNVAPGRLFHLGAPLITSPGMTFEKVSLRAAEITEEEWEGRDARVGDGSPMEEGGELVLAELDEALAECYAGKWGDGKTELALYRFKFYLERRRMSK